MTELNRQVVYPNARLLVFAKVPRPGHVKTRLVPALGARGAARFYRRLLWYTLTMATQSRLCPVELWCAPSMNHPFFTACRREFQLRLRLQQGKDLGERMDHAFRICLQESAYAVIIGADCPALKIQDIRTALEALASAQEAVLGPAQDGGYVLIGLRQPVSRLFCKMAWGGSQVLKMTRQRLRQQGLKWMELEERWDVDRIEDLQRLKRVGLALDVLCPVCTADYL
jgi:Uncharacterized protein conserved in bacteria